MFVSRHSALTAALCLLVGHATIAGTVTLTNGDKINGTITSTNDEVVTVEHKDLGTLELSADQVKDVKTDENDPAYVYIEPTGWFFPGWDKTVEAGFNGTSGNSDTLSAYGRFNTQYEDDHDRWTISARIFYAEDDGENTRSEWQASAFKDWLMPGQKHFYFANAKYEHDRFTGWTDRTSGFVGIGYPFVDEPSYDLIGRAGVGGNYEAGDINEFTPELLLSLEGSWKVDPRSTLNYYTFLYPSLDPAFSEFRNVSGINYKISIDRGNGLSLKVGCENEYNSEVAPGTDNNDFKYFGALVYDF